MCPIRWWADSSARTGLPDPSRRGPRHHRPASSIGDARPVRKHADIVRDGAACAMAVVLYLTWHRSSTPFGLPAILIGGVMAAHIVFLAGRHLVGRGAGRGVDLSAAAAHHLHVAVEPGRHPQLSLVRLAGTLGQSDRGGFRHGVMHLVQHHGRRSRDAARSQSGAGTERHRRRQYALRRIGGLHRLRSISRSVLNFNGGGTGPLSGLTVAAISLLMLAFAPNASRLHAEIRARRPC